MTLRKSYVDFLKAIGILLVILAHVNPPTTIMFIRCFDVPLLVLLSGILANDSLDRLYAYKDNDARFFLKYYYKRFNRLVIPTWIMLVFIFSIQAIFGKVYPPKYYLFSFSLTRNGIGCVWIVLIFLYCAILAPFIKKCLSFRYYWFVLALVYCLYEIAYGFQIGTNNFVILNTIYYFIPYGLLTSLGMSYTSMTKRVKITICLASLFIFAICAVYYHCSIGELPTPAIAKYPPRLYFLSYSIALSFFLLILCEGRDNRLFRSPLVLFISSHSLWIFLWHIVYLYLSENVSFTGNWVLRYCFVIVLSTATVWLQNRLLDKLETVFKRSVPKYLRG